MKKLCLAWRNEVSGRADSAQEPSVAPSLELFQDTDRFTRGERAAMAGGRGWRPRRLQALAGACRPWLWSLYRRDSLQAPLLKCFTHGLFFHVWREVFIYCKKNSL